MADYETRTITGAETYSLDSGETLENVLFDCTAPNADLTIVAHGTNWTIQNIGILGAMNCTDTCIGLSDRGNGNSTFKNVYMGDGVSHNNAHNGGAIWVAPQHSGHIDFVNCNIQEWADNGIYGSAPGLSKGNGGTIHIENCYSANNYVSNFRLCNGHLRDSVAVNTAGDGWDGRCLWAWGPGPVEIRGCDLDANGRHYSIVSGAHSGATTVDVYDTQIDTGQGGGTSTKNGSSINFHSNTGERPENYIPDGVPTSAEDAASGGDGGGGRDQPGSPVEQMADPLPPTDPGEYRRVITLRNLDAERSSYCRVWLESTDPNKATQVTPYGGSYEAVGVNTDEDRGGRVVISMGAGGEDGDDPNAPVDDQGRKSVAVRGAIHDIEMGPDSVPSSAPINADEQDGPSQIEVTNGDNAWITEWFPDSLEWPDGNPDQHFDPLEPVDASPYEHSLVARNAADDEFEIDVWVAIPSQSLDDWTDRSGDDYDSSSEASLEPELYDENAERTN